MKPPLRTVRVTLEITHDSSFVDPAEWDWNEVFGDGCAHPPSREALSITIISSEEVEP